TVAGGEHSFDVRDPVSMNERLDPISGSNFVRVAREVCETAGITTADVALLAPAVLAMTDQLGLGMLLVAASRGISVPEDLSVVGFDDVPRAGVSSPPLTTIRQPLFEKGRAALRILASAAAP
ncbi:MAG: substrate-binding domain-containing protein, partial [Acidimicrobiia bacterium]